MGGRQSVNHILENAPQPIPLAKLKFLAENAPKSICHVETETGTGSAGLYCFKEIIGTYYVFITCQHVLAPNQVVSAKFHFEGFEKFKLQSNWIGHISSQPKENGDFTVIELKQAAINFLIYKGATFLKFTSPRTEDQIIII